MPTSGQSRNSGSLENVLKMRSVDVLEGELLHVEVDERPAIAD